MYHQYQAAIKSRVLPWYITHIICFFLMIYFDDGKYEHTFVWKESVTDPKTGEVTDIEKVCNEACTELKENKGKTFYYALQPKEHHTRIPSFVFVLANLFMICYFIRLNFKKARVTKINYIYNVWAIIDILFLVLNIIICVGILFFGDISGKTPMDLRNESG